MATRKLTDGERRLMVHVAMWGSDGYPIERIGRSWTWGTADVPGPPVVYRTKRACVEAFERYYDVLIALVGEEARERALAGQVRP